MTGDAAALRRAIEMLERGEAGREVDEAIALAIGWKPHPAPEQSHYWQSPDKSQWVLGTSDYSTSIDAAVTLVPDGWTVGGLRQDDRKCWHAELREGHATSFDRVIIVPCALIGFRSPAAALALAALRARLAIIEREGK